MEQKQEVVYYQAKGGKYRWVAVTALLLAIGAILKMVTPGVAGITPNWTIAMYCIAINLIRPSLGQSAGIGLVAGAVNIPFSKSAFPYGNLASELVGAVVCAVIVNAAFEIKLGQMNIRPAVTGFLSTICSGLVFTGILKIVLSLPLEAYLYGMLPVVFITGAINTVITQLLYLPAQRLFEANGGQHVRNSN
ncbi:tryptophan transporter [Dendrosporobacter sp. 1207_IL3150]|uniref:tryptophan transporter n=1 Tax=Dendrosporobacter sp. 1207_IL3150 TaxID=3084054 RepID=UPI002FDB572F